MPKQRKKPIKKEEEKEKKPYVPPKRDWEEAESYCFGEITTVYGVTVFTYWNKEKECWENGVPPPPFIPPSWSKFKEEKLKEVQENKSD